ncbi:uncharacterized protein LOC129407384, partial [Boleophthalmus pectinirostris]|uniref:uncharacterized protein LOC129407384 n=1 Tax=Boleophthalmus pectinirostris TaxID=150288 RepID=UPI00242BA92F
MEIKAQEVEVDQDFVKMEELTEERDKKELHKFKTLNDRLEQKEKMIQRAVDKLVLLKAEVQERTEPLDLILDNIKKEKDTLSAIQTQVKLLVSSVVDKQQELKPKYEDGQQWYEENLDQIRKVHDVAIEAERQQLDKVTQTDIEKHALDDEKEAVNRKLSELHEKESRFSYKISSVETFCDQLQQRNKCLQEEMQYLSTKMLGNKNDIQSLFSVLQQDRSALNDQKQNIISCKESLNKLKFMITQILTGMSKGKEVEKHEGPQMEDSLVYEEVKERDSLDRTNQERDWTNIDIYKQLDKLAND